MKIDSLLRRAPCSAVAAQVSSLPDICLSVYIILPTDRHRLMEMPSTMYLPDPMKTWPWTRQINPHYKEVSAQSTAWLHSLKLLGPKSQRAFDKCDTGTSVVHVHSHPSHSTRSPGCPGLSLCIKRQLRRLEKWNHDFRLISMFQSTFALG
jgi:hypothetical protein